MIAEILCIGTEILLGDIVNTNAQFLAKQLADLGITVYYQTAVGDNPKRIKAALDTAYQRDASLVILSGGLGPTKDDLTKEMIADYFHKELIFDQKAYENVEKKGFEFGLTSISDSLRKQAYVPKDSIILYNTCGTAPGCIIEDSGKIAILLPGPPKEMQPMFMECRKSYLEKLSTHRFVSVNVKLMAHKEAPAERVGEAPVADLLSDLLDFPNPTVATYAKDDGCLIRITAKAVTKEEARQLIAPVLEEVKHRLSDVIKSITED